MRRILPLAAVAALFLPSPAGAQTTGVVCINDYTINGLFPGSTSCPPLPPFPAGLTVFSVSTSAPGLPVTFVISPVPFCCPGVLCLPPSPCLIPFTACPVPPPGTNQSIDICPPVFFIPCGPAAPDPANPGCGICTVAIPIPPGVRFSTQAFVIDPGCAIPGLGLVLTQAYAVSII